MRISVLLFAASLVASCGGEPASEPVGSVEARIAASDSWPQEVVGVLDIVDAGGYESDYPDWAVGMLVTADDPDGISINIGDGVLAAGRVDIDDGRSVRVWVNKPNTEYGVLTFPVTKVKYE